MTMIVIAALIEFSLKFIYLLFCNCLQTYTNSHSFTLAHTHTPIYMYFLFQKHFYTGYEWVGWRNDSMGMAGKPVEMTFEFDSVRNFSSIILHTNNMFSKDVAVSHRINSFLSIHCETMRNETIHLKLSTWCIFTNTWNKLKIHFNNTFRLRLNWAN